MHIGKNRIMLAAIHLAYTCMCDWFCQNEQNVPRFKTCFFTLSSREFYALAEELSMVAVGQSALQI